MLSSFFTRKKGKCEGGNFIFPFLLVPHTKGENWQDSSYNEGVVQCPATSNGYRAPQKET
jgi:hypothetical protein